LCRVSGCVDERTFRGAREAGRTLSEDELLAEMEAAL